MADSKQHANLDQAKSNRSFRFSLRALLIAATVVGLGGGWLAAMVSEAARQRNILAAIEATGASIVFTEGYVARWTPSYLDTHVLEGVHTVEFVNSRVSDISALKEFKNLEVLDISGTSVSDLSPLQGLKNLETLRAANTLVDDISVLHELTNLRLLNLDNTPIRDIEAVRSLRALQELRLAFTHLDDISSLKELTNLELLDLTGTDISDASSLKKLENLRILGIRATKVRKQDAEMLKKALPSCYIMD